MNMQEEFDELKDIIQSVSGFDIHRRSKKTEFVYARMVFYALTRNIGYTYQNIGDYLNKDHATVLVGQRKFYDLITRDAYLRDMYLECSNVFKEKRTPRRVTGSMPRNSFIEDLQYQIDSLILENEKLQKTKMMNNRFKDILKEMDDRTPVGMESILSEKIVNILNGDTLR
jgi:hypothetical protein